MPPHYMSAMDGMTSMYDVNSMNMHAFDAMPPTDSQKISGSAEPRNDEFSTVYGECDWCGGDMEVQTTASLIHRLLDDLRLDQRTAVLRMLQVGAGKTHGSGEFDANDEIERVEIFEGSDALTGVGRDDQEVSLVVEDDDSIEGSGELTALDVEDEVVGACDVIALGADESDDEADESLPGISGARESTAAKKIAAAKKAQLEEINQPTGKTPINLDDFSDVTPFIAMKSAAATEESSEDYVSSGQNSSAPMYEDNYNLASFDQAPSIKPISAVGLDILNEMMDVWG